MTDAEKKFGRETITKGDTYNLTKYGEMYVFAVAYPHGVEMFRFYKETTAMQALVQHLEGKVQ